MDETEIEAWHRRIRVDEPLGENSTRYMLRIGEQGLENHIATFKVEADPANGFEEYLYWRPLTELMTFSLLRTPCATERTAQLVAEYPSRFVLVATQHLPGGGAVVQDGRVLEYAHPRHLVMVHNQEPFTQISETVADLAGIWVPTELLGIPAGEPWSMAPMVDSSPLARATAAYVASFANDIAARRADVDTDTEVAVAGLIRAVLSTHRADTFQPADSELYVREVSRSLIEQNYRDPAFNADTLAQMLYVSRRHMYRYFADTGTTPAKLIAQRRLDQARRLLAGNSGMGLAEVAAASGFASAGTMSKRFRAEYGMSPSDYRRSAQSETAQNRQQDSGGD
ncbi:AraC family transcriptional regulator [Gordonia hirsuta]|nr:helix-turn-helix domain-containing protein [Gordonia hirsuta]